MWIARHDCTQQTSSLDRYQNSISRFRPKSAGSHPCSRFLPYVFAAMGFLTLPEAPWHRLVDSFGYSLGFLIVILDQQQLFTETTLTALIPALTERTPSALVCTGVSKTWGRWLAGLGLISLADA